MEPVVPTQPARLPPKPGQIAPVVDEETARRFRKRKSKKKMKKSSSGTDTAGGGGGAQMLYNAGVRAKRAGEVEKALDCYQRAAESGYTKAMVNLGALYEKGDGVLRNDEAAVGWFRKGANLGDAAAQFALGMHLKRGLGVAKDPEEAWAQLSRAAHSGHVAAQFNLALMCESAVGCELNLPRAKELYEAAAAQGHAKAMVNLGSLYDRGTNIPRGGVMPHGPAAAAAARLSNAPQQTNPALACEMYRQALEVGGEQGGSGLAKYNLSCNLKQGRGVAVDDDTAVELLAAAAAEGVPQAQYNLATYVLRGAGRGRAGHATARGTALPTPEAAMALLAKAADGGAEKAARSLARIAVAEARGGALETGRTSTTADEQNDQAPANALSRAPNDHHTGVRGAPSDACRARVRAAVEKRRADRRLPAGGPGDFAAVGGARASARAGANTMEVADITDSSEEDDEEREAARRRRREQNRQRVERRRQQNSRTSSGGRGTVRAAPVTATMFTGRSREPSLPS